MTDYQVLCICIAVEVVVLIVCIAVLLWEWIDCVQHKVLSNRDYNYIHKRLHKVEKILENALVFTSKDFEIMKEPIDVTDNENE